MLDERRYMAEVDKMMEKLRARCLGQDTQMTALLPPHMKDKSARFQAQYLAAQLQFALVHTAGSYVDTKQQMQSRRWLEVLSRYLLEETNEEDQTFYQLVRLMKIHKEVRNLILQNYLDTENEARTGNPPQLMQDNLEAAIWWLLGVQGKQRQSNLLFKKFYTLYNAEPNS